VGKGDWDLEAGAQNALLGVKPSGYPWPWRAPREDSPCLSGCKVDRLVDRPVDRLVDQGSPTLCGWTCSPAGSAEQPQPDPVTV